ncbi:MAG: TetR/AcrR family transcriptional regulator [Defluviitaleaceae bacterium]|nr:TetR/AcrR family transcriptional regulator [Defluviitaleaceae bacterium]
MPDKFLTLPEEKQNAIIDAALAAFSRNGYKKASINDIAVSAGISKAMVFHYFGSKKALYLYLVSYCGELLVNVVKAGFDESVTDFFDRLKMASETKVSVLKKHPDVYAFITGIMLETDPEIAEELKNFIRPAENFQENFYYKGIDLTKFRDDIDPELIMRLLIWASEGHASEARTEEELDAFVDDIYRVMALMKKYFYK